jgi:transcriptional regulator with XRE-family HTH domain
MIKLYENIRKLRKQNGWSQEELAKRMGYTDRSMIAKIEAGKVDLAQSKIVEFAKIFNVEPGELMGWEDSEYILHTEKEILYGSDNLEDLHNPEEIKKAMELYELYKKLTPENRTAFQTLLASLQTRS